MSDIRFPRLEKYRVGGTRDKMELSVPVPRTDSGKIYQYSPNKDAVPRLFLLGDAPPERRVASECNSRMQREPGKGETVCPYSGYIGPDEEFRFVEDVEAIKKQMIWAAEQDIHDHLEQMTRDFNREMPRGGMLSISMNLKKTSRPKPLTIREDLLRELECAACQRSYGVYAIALFCPDCGAPNAAQHFEREVHLVAEQIGVADEKNGQGRRASFQGGS